MKERRELLARVFGVGLTWGGLWLALVLLLGVALAYLRPGSIDRGEGPMMFLAVLGPMGLFAGVVFAALLLWKDRTRAATKRSFVHAIACGIAATALVQLAFLGHGDQGFTANLGTAAMFSAIGGVVAATWLALARGWARWRSSETGGTGGTARV